MNGISQKPPVGYQPLAFDCDEGHSDIALTPNGTPHIVYSCWSSEGVHLWPLEAFPQSYHDACDSAVAILCPEACACQPSGDCCYH